MPLDSRTDSLVTAQVAKVAFLVSAAGSAQAVSTAVLCASGSVDPQILLRVIMIDFRLFILLALLAKFHMLGLQLFLLNVQRLRHLLQLFVASLFEFQVLQRIVHELLPVDDKGGIRLGVRFGRKGLDVDIIFIILKLRLGL